jgi:hypothetical protein
VLKGNFLTVNTLDTCLATRILKHICVGEDAIGSYLVNIVALMFAMINVETVKWRWVCDIPFY